MNLSSIKGRTEFNAGLAFILEFGLAIVLELVLDHVFVLESRRKSVVLDTAFA